jgi:hypothetical protein
MEPVPEMKALEPPVSLREGVAQGRMTANWVSLGRNQVRLSLRNVSENPAAVVIDPGTVLSDGGNRWLAGGPSRFAGAFGGQFVFDHLTDHLSSATVPTLPGKVSTLDLPAVALVDGIPGSKLKFGQRLTSETVEVWSNDRSLRKVLTGLSMLGSSLHVAQGIAWRAIEAKTWKELAGRQVQGALLNEFEKRAVDRYLSAIARCDSSSPDKLRQALLVELLDVVVRPSPGKNDVAKRLGERFERQSIFGLPIGKTFAGASDEKAEKPLKLEIGIVEVHSIEPLRLIVDVSLSSPSEMQGGTIRSARTRLEFGSDSADSADSVTHFLVELADRLAPALVRTERVGIGPMYSKFRIENRSPWTFSAVALRTDKGGEEPAIWPVDGLGLSPRGRVLLPVPADRAVPVDIRWSPI